MKKIFLAGATGFTGKTILQQKADLEFVIPVREGSRSYPAWKDDPRTVQVNYADASSLQQAMKGCDAVLNTIGTTRAQFKEGINYETVDYGVTIYLLEAAKSVGVKHFVLMSSLGAGHPIGPYLRWKALTECAVADSGLPHTIVRPAYLQGKGRPWPEFVNKLTDVTAGLPGLKGIMKDIRAIPIEVLAWNFCHMLEEELVEDGVLTGRDLWRRWDAKFGK